MKIDVGLRSHDLQALGGEAAAYERLGADGLWSSETVHDPFLPLLVAALATERVALGTGIAVAFARTPFSLAQTAWDLQRASRGRLLLGLGTQVRAHIERRFAAAFERPGGADRRLHRLPQGDLGDLPERPLREQFRCRGRWDDVKGTRNGPRHHRARGDADPCLGFVLLSPCGAGARRRGRTGWPLAWVVGGLSLGLVTAGLVSPQVGHTIERPRRPAGHGCKRRCSSRAAWSAWRSRRRCRSISPPGWSSASAWARACTMPRSRP